MDIQQLSRRVRVARGDEPGDLLIADGRVANVFTERGGGSRTAHSIAA